MSEIVQACLASVAEPPSPATGAAPILRSVRGVLENADIDAHRKHLAARGGLGGRRGGRPGRHAGPSRDDDDPLIVPAILRVFGVAAVDGTVGQEAAQLPFSDFEDAVTAADTRLAGCECIVTPEAVRPLLGAK